MRSYYIDRTDFRKFQLKILSFLQVFIIVLMVTIFNGNNLVHAGETLVYTTSGSDSSYIAYNGNLIASVSYSLYIYGQQEFIL